MAKDLTEGSCLKQILLFAVPLLVGNLLQQTYNLVDAAIVGRCLGTDALAAVGASSSVQFLVLGFCIGTCAGFGIPIAQRFGAKDYGAMRSYIFHSMLLTALFAVILTSLCALLCPNILHMLSTPEDIFSGAYSYLLIIFLGIPFTLLYNLEAAMLRAVGDSRTPFVFLAVSTVTNIVLDLLCILVLQWGVAGAAAATITAQALSGIFCLLFIRRKQKILHIRQADCCFDRNCCLSALTMGAPMGLQFSITAIGSMVMQSANNGLGSVYVSGFTAGARLKQFTICPFDALATAVCTFCGQNLGAKRFDRIRQGIRVGVVVSSVYGVLIGLVLIFGGRVLSMLFMSSSQAAVLDASAKYLRYLGCMYWMLGFLNVFRQTIQGLGYSGRAVFAGVIEMAARTVVSLVFVPVYGYTAICCADQVAWVTAVMYLIPMGLYLMNRLEREAKVTICCPLNDFH